ncbi:MAG: hypothetical protein ACYCXC_00150 [Acidovorax defluvii]
MTLLELVRQVCDELMIQRPQTVAGSTDPQIRQLLALLNRLGVDLSRQAQWQRLNREHILTTVAINQTGNTVAGSNVITGIPSTVGITPQFGVNGPGTTPFAQVTSVGANQVALNMPMTETLTGASFQFSQVAYDLPSDWLSEIPQTEWDRTNRWPLLGPQSPQDWQSFKSGIVYAGPRQRFRIQENQILINPPPPNGLLFSLEYISNGWVINSVNQRLPRFTNDTDTAIFPDSLLITGLKAQWKAAKGLDGTFDLAEFRVMLETIKAQDKSAPKLSLSPQPGEVLLSVANIQDGNWPG